MFKAEPFFLSGLIIIEIIIFKKKSLHHKLANNLILDQQNVQHDNLRFLERQLSLATILGELRRLLQIKERFQREAFEKLGIFIESHSPATMLTVWTL